MALFLSILLLVIPGILGYVHVPCAVLKIFTYSTYNENMPGNHITNKTAVISGASMDIVVTTARSYHDPLQTRGCFAGSACIGLKMRCGISERLEVMQLKIEIWTV